MTQLCPYIRNVHSGSYSACGIGGAEPMKPESFRVQPGPLRIPVNGVQEPTIHLAALGAVPWRGREQHWAIGHVPLAELNQFPAKVSGNVDVPFLVCLGSPVLEFRLALNTDNPTSVIVQPYIALVQVG